MGESDIFRSAQLLPGVSSNQENNGGLTIRGGATDQTLMLLDGKIADIRVLPAVGCEKFAEHVYNHVSKIIEQSSGGRVWLDSVECREHGANSAIYQRD
jgi:hypothetical protein